ncbi:MAG: hypothetical protein ACT6QS_08390 [Flavobacteriales bacterium]
MKKNLLSVGAVALVAFAVSFSSCGTKGCLTTTDDNYNSEATIDDPEACDAMATDAKFVGNWTFQISGSGTYAVSVTDASADYSITANTDFGLNGVSPQNVTLAVNQKEATASNVTIGNATITDLKFTYISTSQATLSGTISGTGTSADGNFSDNGTK